MMRKATAEDREAFSVLWAEFLRDANKLGSDILPTVRNLQTMMRIFDAYVEGSLSGVVVMAFLDSGEPIGAAMAGEMSLVQNFDSSLGRIAAVWGHYVRESHRGDGVALKMDVTGAGHLRELGFDVATAPVLDCNPASMKTSKNAGAEIHSSVILVRLGGM